MTAVERGETQLGWGRLAIFSLPVLLIQAIEIPWRVYLPSFLTGTLGIGLAAAGTLLAAIRLFDTGFDLFVGSASDRWPTRFGRRKPWMAAGVPLIVAGAAGVFLARPGVPLVVLCVSAVLLHVGYTMVVTPHGGWGLEIGRTPRERLRVIATKTWFGALAMPLVVLLPSVSERIFAADLALQMRAMGMAIMLLAPAIILLVLRTVPEPRTGPAAPPDPDRRGAWWEAARLLRDPDAARIALLYALAGLTEATGSGSFLFFVDGPLALKNWASTLLLAQALIALASLPGWAWLAARIGKSRALSLALAVQAIIMPLILIAPPNATGVILVLMAVRYATWGADFLLLRTMVADLAGRTIASGRNNSASYYAAFNVTLRLSFSLGAGLVLWIPALLDLRPGDGEPFDDAVRLIFTVPTCLGAICSLVLLTRARKSSGYPRPLPRRALCRSVAGPQPAVASADSR